MGSPELASAGLGLLKRSVATCVDRQCSRSGMPSGLAYAWYREAYDP